MVDHYKNNFSSKDIQEDVPFKRDNIVYLDIPKLIILLKDGGVTSKQSARFMNVNLKVPLQQRLLNMTFCRKQSTSTKDNLYPLDAELKLNVHNSFRSRPGQILNVLYTYNLRSVSRGCNDLNPLQTRKIYGKKC